MTKDADEAAKLAEELRYDTAMRYLRGGVEYLKESGVAADRVGWWVTAWAGAMRC